MPSKTTEFQETLDRAWEEMLSGQDTLPISDVKEMLDMVGIDLPNYKVRDMTAKMDQDGLSKPEFAKLCESLMADDVANTFKVTRDADKASEKIERSFGYTMVSDEEEAAFADWINKKFASDPDVNHKFPLSLDGKDLYEKCDDGILLCKIINLAAPDTIDERVINKGKNISLFKQIENLRLAINSAKAIGCVVIGIDTHNINSKNGRKWLLLGMMWQLIKMSLFKDITIKQVPGMMSLLMPGEDPSVLMKLSPEQLLLRWVNHQLEKSGSDRRVKNFTEDIKDSEVYTDLIHQIAPKDAGVNKNAMSKSDLTERAEEMLNQADKIDCRSFVTAKDVVKGHDKLNLAFVANLFNNYPALEVSRASLEDIIEETREEKMYRNWMNSLGVKPTVNHLYTDLYDGLILFQLMDFIKPGIVDWNKRVITLEQMSKWQAMRMQEVLGNCNYAVELGKKLGFKLIGVGGVDIMNGNVTLTLALIWQLMRAYTLSLLTKLNEDGTPIVESEILDWANNKMSDAGKNISIRSFQDKTIKTALPILHLIDVIKPDAIDWSVIDQGEEASLPNAKYCIAIARKIGAPVYALPEDISEVKHKMVMTIYASLMLADRS